MVYTRRSKDSGRKELKELKEKEIKQGISQGLGYFKGWAITRAGLSQGFGYHKDWAITRIGLSQGKH